MSLFTLSCLTYDDVVYAQFTDATVPMKMCTTMRQSTTKTTTTITITAIIVIITLSYALMLFKQKKTRLLCSCAAKRRS